MKVVCWLQGMPKPFRADVNDADWISGDLFVRATLLDGRTLGDGGSSDVFINRSLLMMWSEEETTC